jgi:hypothetical protein
MPIYEGPRIGVHRLGFLARVIIITRSALRLLQKFGLQTQTARQRPFDPEGFAYVLYTPARIEFLYLLDGRSSSGLSFSKPIRDEVRLALHDDQIYQNLPGIPRMLKQQNFKRKTCSFCLP